MADPDEKNSVLPKETAAESPEAAKNALAGQNPESVIKGQTRSDLMDLANPEKLEKDKKAKQDEATHYRTPEDWVNIDPATTGSKMPESTVKAQINDTVEAKFKEPENVALLQKSGLFGTELVTQFKGAIGDIMYEHYLRHNDMFGGATKTYGSGEFFEKISFFFGKMDAIYNDPRYASIFGKDPLKNFISFNDYSGLNFYSNGAINSENLKTLLRIKKEDLEKLATGYTEYLNIQLQLNLKPGAKPSAETPEKPASQEKPPTANKPASVQEKPAGANPSPAPSASPAGNKETPVPESNSVKTGIGFVDKALDFLKLRFPRAYTFALTIVTFLKGKIDTVSNYTSKEFLQQKMKEALKSGLVKLGINKNIVDILFSDNEQVNKVLEFGKNKNVSDWSEYLKKTIPAAAMSLLIKEPGEKTNAASKIASILLTGAIS